jgi:hypothetical protein
MKFAVALDPDQQRLDTQAAQSRSCRLHEMDQ